MTTDLKPSTKRPKAAGSEAPTKLPVCRPRKHPKPDPKRVKHLQASAEGCKAKYISCDPETARQIEFIQKFLATGLQLKPSITVLFRRAVLSYKLWLIEAYGKVYTSSEMSESEKLEALGQLLEDERFNLELVTGR